MEYYSRHSGVKYKLEKSQWTGEATGTVYDKLGLWCWYNLTKEYIFERTVKDEEDAKKAIDFLLHDGFVTKSN